MADDLDIEAMLEASYSGPVSKPSASSNGLNTSVGDESRPIKRRSRSRSRGGRSPRGGRSHRSRSRDNSRSSPRHSRDRSRGDRSRDRSRSDRRRSRDRSNHRSPERPRRRSTSRSRDRGEHRQSGGPDTRRYPGGDSGSRSGGRGHDSRPGRNRNSPSAKDASQAGLGMNIVDDEVDQIERDARTVFVMQLARNATPRAIEDFFSKVGKVRDVRLISDRNSRRMKGIAYVEFAEVASVTPAIGMSGQKLLGVPIMVQATMAEKNRAAAAAAAKPTGPTKLYVGSLHYNINEDMLRSIFEPFGAVDSVNLMHDPETGRSKGYGFVQFHDADSAKKAMDQLNGFELAGRAMKIGHVTERMDGSANSLLDDEETDKGGIGMNAASRVQLMQKLAANHGLGMQVPNTPIIPGVIQSAVPPSVQPTPCMLLANLFDPSSETDPNWDRDVADDVVEEVSKHAPVCHISVDKTHAEGLVYLRCTTPEGAAAAIRFLNGRFFAGRTIKASFIPMTSYLTMFPEASVAVQPLPNSR